MAAVQLEVEEPRLLLLALASGVSCRTVSITKCDDF